MTMAEIWLTAAAQDAFNELKATSPEQADAVTDAINNIPRRPGRPINLPGAPPDAPFLAKEPSNPYAPAILYRHSTLGEQGEWLVVSLMKRDDYRAARQAERELAAYPPNVQSFVRRAIDSIAGTAATTFTQGDEAPDEP
jgi:hypothetical protein